MSRYPYFFIILFSTIVRFLFSVTILDYNLILGPSDSTEFHNLALELRKHFTWGYFDVGWVYSYLLFFFYTIFIESRIIGFLLSCFAWGLSACVFIKLISLFSFTNKEKLLSLIIYSFIPSSVFYASDTLREPYQMLLNNILIFYSLKFYDNKSIWVFVKIFFISILLSTLHHVFIIYTIFIIVYSLKKVNFSFFLLGLFILAWILFYNIHALPYFSNDVDILQSVTNFNEIGRSLEANTMYIPLTVTSGGINYLLNLVFSFFQYLLEPFPWNIRNLFDLIIFLENFIRYLLVFFILKFMFKTRKNIKHTNFLIFAFILLEFLWSIGTNNWGTAIRHHLPSFGCSIILLIKLINSPK